jgi:hypothetical protein
MTQLDAAGPGLTALAALAEQGDHLERDLLTPPLLAACEHAMAAWTDEHARYSGVRERALAASRTIATTGADQPGHRSAAREFWSARAELARLRPQWWRTRESAYDARVRIEQDRRRRRLHTGEIEQGRKASAELEEVLSARLSEALEWDWPLPPWFTAALGAVVPESDPGRWWRTAVGLLAYRITYGVDDPASALGPRPEPEAGARRAQWFAELEQELFARPLGEPVGRGSLRHRAGRTLRPGGA